MGGESQAGKYYLPESGKELKQAAMRTQIQLFKKMPRPIVWYALVLDK
jgi:hypothetical protein